MSEQLEYNLLERYSFNQATTMFGSGSIQPALEKSSHNFWPIDMSYRLFSWWVKVRTLFSAPKEGEMIPVSDSLNLLAI